MKKIESKKWFLVEEIQRADLFRCYLALGAICAERNLEGIDIQVKNGALGLSQEKSDLIFERGEWERNGQYLVNLIKKQKSKFFKKVNNGISKSAIKLNKYIDEKIFNVKSLSYKEALIVYKKTYSLLIDLYNWAFIYEILELGEKKLLTSYIKDIIKKKKKGNVNDYFNTLTQSTRKSWVKKEEVEFLELVSSKNSYDLVNEHYQKFFWIPSFGSFAIWDKNYFKNKIKKFKEDPLKILKEHKKEKKELKDNIKKVEKELNLTKEEKDTFSEIRELAYFKDYRRGVQNKLFLAIYRNILPVLGKKLKIKKENLRWLTLEELENRWFDKEEIKKRKKGFLFLIEDGKKPKIITGQPRDNLPYQEIENNIKNGIKGTIAYKGDKPLLRGKVKIILNRKDMKKFKKGDILVSYMTNPDLMEAIYNSRAIITDMGGITCHASIVARELKKPCIIGTKIATKALKDGDLVEVDVEKGIVKIIEKR